MARTTTRHTIVYKAGSEFGPIREEAIGTGAIIPGDLLEKTSAGKVQRCAVTDYGTAFRPIRVAVETQTPDTDEYPTSAKIDIPYASGETVYFVTARAGDILNMRLADGGGTLAIGSHVTSSGAGALKLADAGSAVAKLGAIVGQAYAANTNSGATASRALIEIG